MLQSFVVFEGDLSGVVNVPVVVVMASSSTGWGVLTGVRFCGRSVAISLLAVDANKEGMNEVVTIFRLSSFRSTRRPQIVPDVCQAFPERAVITGRK